MTEAREYNFDGIVGPTHNYAGLSLGNLASVAHKGQTSSPRAAALQGLAKMRILHSLGIGQGVLPPHPRPSMSTLRRLGFPGSPGDAVVRLSLEAPDLLPLVYSASAMWTANAATVSPSADTGDVRVHLTPANLVSHAHRAIEAHHTTAVLRAIFADPAHFAVHDPLPATPAFGDEGAANHMRVAGGHGRQGVEVFVFGSIAGEPVAGLPRRQTRRASEAVARLHQVRDCRFWQQNPGAIDAGAFHNDVVAVANERAVLYHAEALDPADVGSLPGVCEMRVDGTRLPLAEAVRTYLFNSQLVSLGDGTMTLIAPTEVESSKAASAEVDRLIAEPDNPLVAVRYVNLRESMSNGGGPACLRLRVVLTEPQAAALRGRVLVDDVLLDELEDWVGRHYRESLTPADLADPDLAVEALFAVTELAEILELPLDQQ